MAIEIVSVPIKHGGSFHSYVSLPEGTSVVAPALQASGTQLLLGSQAALRQLDAKGLRSEEMPMEEEVSDCQGEIYEVSLIVCFMMFYDVLWCFMMFYDVVWCCMMFDDVWGCLMMFDDVCFMMFYGGYDLVITLDLWAPIVFVGV